MFPPNGHKECELSPLKGVGTNCQLSTPQANKEEAWGMGGEGGREEGRERGREGRGEGEREGGKEREEVRKSMLEGGRDGVRECEDRGRGWVRVRG